MKTLAAILLIAQLGADNKPIPPPPPRIDPYQSCGKAFHDQYNKLNNKQKKYYESETQATANVDLDGEGTLDFIIAESDPNLYPCSLTDWEKHTNRLSIRYDADHVFEYEWQGDIIKGMRIYKEKKMIQVYGEKITGEGWQQTIPYELPDGRGK